MQQVIESLNTFLEKIQLSKVKVDKIDCTELDYYFKLKDLSEDKAFAFFEKKMLNKYNIKLSADQKLIYYVSLQLNWRREAQEPGEFLLKGGVFFNGMSDIFSPKPTIFFDDSLNKFLEYEDASKTDIDLIHRLKFIECPTSLQSAEYTPYYGCVTLEEGKFPTEFYFYDSGVVYKLPFTSYEEYIDALIQSAAVNCWQYFYIDPTEIISKNKGIQYITWGLHTRTRLDKELAGLQFVPNAKQDRLDLIHEYLEQCVKLLPGTFPFLNLEHHLNYYERFQELYEASKG